MTLVEHLTELRSRVLVSAAAFVIAATTAFLLYVHGHEKVPGYGHLRSPLVATKVPAFGHEKSPPLTEVST